MPLKPSRRIPRAFQRSVSPLSQRIARKRLRRKKGELGLRFVLLARQLRRFLRSAQSSLTYLKLWIYSSIGLFFILLVLYFLFSPLFSISSMQVSREDRRTDVEEIQKLLSPFFGKHILFVSPALLEHTLLKEYPEVSSVRVRRNFPNELQIALFMDPIVANVGYSVSYGGQFEAQQSASKTLYVMGGMVAVLMLLLLNMSVGSTKTAVLVMINLPLALIGGIVAIFLTESDHVGRNVLALFGVGGRYEAPVISIASMVGFITLFGIAVRNGILLVNHYAHLIKEEGKSLSDAIMQGSQERLVPILMTALTAVLGLLPIAWAAGEPGSEILAPMAIVVLGGLVTSTFLNLLVIPAGYALIFHVPRLDYATEKK